MERDRRQGKDRSDRLDWPRGQDLTIKVRPAWGPGPRVLQSLTSWGTGQAEVVITLEDYLMVLLDSDPRMPKSCLGSSSPPAQGPWEKSRIKRHKALLS